MISKTIEYLMLCFGVGRSLTDEEAMSELKSITGLHEDIIQKNLDEIESVFDKWRNIG